MSLLVYMVANNIPLYTWREVAEENPNRGLYDGYCTKNLDNVARIIVNSCSSNDAVDLIARDWDLLDPKYRMAISFEANKAMGTRSNNKTKGLSRLNDLLDGRLLRSVDARQTERVLKVVAGKLMSSDKPINPAISGASISFANFNLPANYNELKPSEKRKLRKKLADERRNQK